jgi:hypothetical protein
MPGSFYGATEFSLMRSASAGSFLWSDFTKPCNKSSKGFRFLEIHFFNIFLAKIAIHKD